MAPTGDLETVRRRGDRGDRTRGRRLRLAGLIHEDREDAYCFANDVDDEELQRMAVRQPRMLTEQSDLAVREVTELVCERVGETTLLP